MSTVISIVASGVLLAIVVWFVLHAMDESDEQKRRADQKRPI